MPISRKNLRKQRKSINSEDSCDEDSTTIGKQKHIKPRVQDTKSVIIARSQILVETPQNFSFNPAEWPKWRIRFERYRSASGLSEESESKQINTLIYTLGEKADDIYASFGITDDSVLSFEDVLNLFEKHFVPKRNLLFERAKFLRRKQRSNESIEDFIVSLHSLAKTCEWGSINDEIVLMVLILGLHDEKLRDRLLLDPQMDLTKAITAIRHAEGVKREKENLNKAEKFDIVDTELVVEKIGSNSVKRSEAQTEKQNSRQSKQTSNYPPQCPWCGSKPSHPKSQCPANKVTCFECKKVGHFSRVCRSRKVEEIQEHEVNELLTSNKTFFVGSLTESRDETKRKPWKVDLVFNGKKLTFKVDSGADVTVIPPGIVPNERVQPTLVELYGAGKAKLETLGITKGNFKYKGVNITHPVYVVKGVTTPLLGRPAIEDLKILSFVNSVTEVRNVFYNEYHELFNGLGVIPYPYTIELKDGAKPYAITSPRPVPLPLMQKVKCELDSMLSNGVISRVDQATEWCSPMVVVPKATGAIRICVDLTKLNECIQRPYHPMPKIETSLSSITGAKFFSKLDANSGFWQVPLDPSSQDLTTFLTPFGRFKFLKLPFGITSAPDHFQRCMNRILANQPNISVHMDDILIWGKSKEEHNRIVRQVLEKLKRVGMTLNRDKTEFGKTSLKFLGHLLSSDGISVDKDKVSAILKMENPRNVKDLQRLNGMINFIGKFIPNKAKIMAPINILLQEGVPWCWGLEQQKAFDDIKSLLTKSPCLAVYDVNRKTIISCDASIKGLGASLSQVQDDGSTRPVSFASRTLLPAEKNYANIEREATAVAWACEKFKEFIIGKRVVVQTDHKPLLQLLKTKHIDDLSPRIQRIRLRLMRYDFTMSYVPGKQLTVADTLSRSPLEMSHSDDHELEEETQAFVQMVLLSINSSDCSVSKVVEEQGKDPTFDELKRMILEGWPLKASVPVALKPYYSVRDELSIDDGLVMRGQRMVIPSSLQPSVMQRIHDGHFGITKCRLRAKESVWWPGLSTAIENMVKNCPVCNQNSTNHHEPLMSTPFPDRPWKCLAMDLFKIDNVWFLTVTDYYSRYFEIAELKCLTSKEVILKCKAFFCRHGIPEEIRSDSGSQFQVLEDSEFKKFSKTYGFKHVTSSPKFSQSNGEAEAAVKVAKMILKKNPEDPYLALLAYRSTPLQNGYSPSQLLMNRRLRSTLPQTSALLKETPNLNDVSEREEKYRKKYKSQYDRRHKVVSLDPLKVGEPVWVIDVKKYGKIVDISENPRSYVIEIEGGRDIRRNRYHLKPAKYFQSDANATKDIISQNSSMTEQSQKRLICKPKWFKDYST